MIYKRQITRKIKHAWCLRCTIVIVVALHSSNQSDRPEKWLTQFILWILFICMLVCLYVCSLSPLGGCLVAMELDKDNTVFICYFFFWFWTNQQVFSRIGWKVINQASPRMRESSLKEEEEKNQQQQQPQNSDETTKWKCFHNSVKHGHMKTNWLWVIECKKSVRSSILFFSLTPE